jgi:hypothetical protein
VERSGEAAPPLACGWIHEGRAPMLDPWRKKAQEGVFQRETGALQEHASPKIHLDNYEDNQELERLATPQDARNCI